ncbi:MAG: type II toxin-antitoxin system RelE/ParE family toxin [Flavobacteriaceae bacterium]|nr:type II toxin-antitoxin system RelE/ParE family toxin [Flavobacteriaceae bacterium]
MANYYLTNNAVIDLAKIWDYTFEQWSELQADNYYEMLISNCEEIANNPNLGKAYEGITPNLLGIKANRHIIFYRKIKKNEIEITRILHGRMDLKNRILK